MMRPRGCPKSRRDPRRFFGQPLEGIVMRVRKFSHTAYTLLLLFIAGMGGLLYGYDIGIIGAALLYIDKTISLTISQESLLVAAVLAGGTISSLVAGMLADMIGRKKLMILAAFLFVGSVILIVLAQSFPPLFLGRTLQGLSAGMIAVIIPLYLAECLPAGIRGRGTAAFQLLLTLGILISLSVGAHYTQGVEAVRNGTSDIQRLTETEDHAWRAMFLSAIYPGAIFLIGSFFVTESPRWLFRKGKESQALEALQKSRTPAEAELEFNEMRQTASSQTLNRNHSTESLFQRKYVVPFCLTCAVLGLTQTTGINSVLQFIVVILKQAGLDATSAAEKAAWVTAINVVFTIVGLLLVDKLGRKILLMLGTGGITTALVILAMVFYQSESKRIDVTDRVRASVQGNTLSIKADASTLGQPVKSEPTQLMVLYAYDHQERMVSASSNDPDPEIKIVPGAQGGTLTIESAKYGAAPGLHTGNLVMICLMLFIASFALGPGVCVWLALSELMPTRIRSIGMGLGLFINQGISTLISAIFLPFVGYYGYTAMFMLWAGFTIAYFLIVLFLLPETKGKTLEEIEAAFAQNPDNPVLP